jgi:acyl carrier protein
MTPTRPGALTREAVHEALWQLAAKRTSTDPARLEPGNRLVEDLGFDSLDVAELTMELEEKLDIRIPGEIFDNASLTLGEVEERVWTNCRGQP